MRSPSLPIPPLKQRLEALTLEQANLLAEIAACNKKLSECYAAEMLDVVEMLCAQITNRYDRLRISIKEVRRLHAAPNSAPKFTGFDYTRY
jgi:hypothetical protein